MKNKVTTLIIAGILTVGGISVAYAASKTNTTFNDFNRPTMGTHTNNSKSSYNSNSTIMGTQNSGTQSYDSFNSMTKIMKDNGFNDEATAMKNGDSAAMTKLMTNISDKDYKKLTDIMQKNGYAPTAKMMQSLNREDMTKTHQSMMGR